MGRPDWASWLMLAGTIPVLAGVLVDRVALLVRRELGLDLIALLSIGGAIILHEYVAAGVIGLMLSGGRALDDFAEARAKREMTALLSRVPRTANRYESGRLNAVPQESIETGDRLLVRAGETVPVDGVVTNGAAVLDESALTGEALPVTRNAGESVRSGGVSAGAPFDMQATTNEAESTFAGIVRLVRAAQEAKAPCPDSRPSRPLVHTAVDRSGRSGLGAEHGPGAWIGRDGRGDALPTDSGRAGGDRLRPLALRRPRRAGKAAARWSGWRGHESPCCRRGDGTGRDRRSCASPGCEPITCGNFCLTSTGPYKEVPPQPDRRWCP
jgi:hypothetical protein